MNVYFQQLVNAFINSQFYLHMHKPNIFITVRVNYTHEHK